MRYWVWVNYFPKRPVIVRGDEEPKEFYGPYYRKSKFHDPIGWTRFDAFDWDSGINWNKEVLKPISEEEATMFAFERD